MNNKIIYWIIVAFFVFVSTIISIFIYPFIDAWVGEHPFKWIVMVFGGVLLITSIVFYYKYKKSKWPSMIMFPVSLVIVFSTSIHVLRFDNRELDLFDDYINCGDIYTKLGFKLIDGNSRCWEVGYNSYGSKLLINWDYNDTHTGDYYYEDCLDSDGNIKKYSKQEKCDLKKVEYEVFIYDEYGEYVDKLVGKYRYTYNSYSEYGYKRKFYGLRSDANRYSNYSDDVLHEEMEDLLLDYGIKLK